MIKISDKLKTAIIQMPQAEKDKLLLRLIAKDYKLIEKLQFELLEGEAKLASRRKEITKYIEASMVTYTGIDTPGWLLMCLRDCNGTITAHTKATKDKVGQISLTLLMLNKAFSVFAEMLQEKQKRANTFAPYVVKRTQDILALVKKLPMDEQESFSVPFNLLLKNIYAYPPTNKEALAANLPKMYGSSDILAQ